MNRKHTFRLAITTFFLGAALALSTPAQSKAQIMMGGGWGGWGGGWGGWGGGFGLGGFGPWGMGVAPGWGWGATMMPAWGWGGVGGWGMPGYWNYGGLGVGSAYWNPGWTLASGLAPLAVESAVIERGLSGVVIPRGQALPPGRYKMTITIEPIDAPAPDPNPKTDVPM